MRAIDKPIHRNELIRLVRECIEAEGEDCDLNHIDVSAMTDFRSVFQVQPFKGDISRWNMSNATSLCRMFQGSTFNGDISGWDVSKVQTFEEMFRATKFKGDLSQWLVSPTANVHDVLSTSTMGSMATSVFHWAFASNNLDLLTPEQQKHWAETAPIAQAIGMEGNALLHFVHAQWCHKPTAHMQFDLPAMELRRPHTP